MSAAAECRKHAKGAVRRDAVRLLQAREAIRGPPHTDPGFHLSLCKPSLARDSARASPSPVARTQAARGQREHVKRHKSCKMHNRYYALRTLPLLAH